MKKIFQSSAVKRLVAFAAGCLLLFLLLHIIFPLKVEVEYAPVIMDRNGKVMHSFLTKDEQWRMFTRLDEITPELKNAIIYKEDKHFYSHFGINPLAVCRAAANNIFHRRRTSGASTITMQVARMLEPKRRTYLNKLVEAFRAVQLEMAFSKDEILQLYLNLIPLGSNIQGVKAGSILYFDKTPDQLSLAEITALSIIPARPNFLVIGKDNDRITYERNLWLQEFENAGLFPPAAIKDALVEPLTAFRHEAPKRLPHLSHRLRREHPSMQEIRTTIDSRQQQVAEDIILSHVRSVNQFHIFNATALIIDNKTREVLAYIGSADPYDYRHQGAVDGVIARRSPGSTLKPFLYALCMDKGIITPGTMIADVPVDYAGYSPENFDLAFRGNITAGEALQQSLNIPAVKLLDRLGVQTFTQSLQEAGAHSIGKQKKDLGLSMILGGCTIRLQELAMLYAALANKGKYAPLRFIKNTDSSHRQKESQVLSPASAYLVSKMISGLYRPDLPNLHDKSNDLPRICWKTGTSYGRKDAWSIGYNSRYTVAVWMGNFNGKGVPELNGAATATPVLFRIFRAIDAKAGEEWLQPDKEVSMRLVCSETGKVPNEFCENQTTDEFIPGVSSNETCDHLREVWVSGDEKIAYCTSCRPATGYKTKSFKNVSAELAAYYDLRHITYEKIPQHHPDCMRTFEGKPPVINSLTDRMTYIILDKDKQKLQLNCTVSNDVQKVYWYVNDKFLTGANAGEKISFLPETDRLKISCSDDKGRCSTININISFL